MKYSFLYLFGILLLIVNSIEKETFDPDTKYFIYNKVTSKCIKREMIISGHILVYHIITYGKCTNDENNLWYIKDNKIILASTDDCLAVINSNNIGVKDCNKTVLEDIYVQDFVFENDTICTRLNNCLKDRRGKVGDKKNKDEYYEWIISTSLPEETII